MKPERPDHRRRSAGIDHRLLRVVTAQITAQKIGDEAVIPRAAVIGGSPEVAETLQPVETRQEFRRSGADIGRDFRSCEEVSRK